MAKRSIKGAIGMRKTILSIFNILPILVFIGFYRRGGLVSVFMVPVWLIMVSVNTACSKTVKEVLKYNILLTVASEIGILIDGCLYLSLVYYDSMGVVVMEAEMLLALVYFAVLTVFAYFIKRAGIKEKNNK